MELNIKGASKGEILKKLFLSTLYLSAFTFGGGYVIFTLMKTKFVNQYHWIDESFIFAIVLLRVRPTILFTVNFGRHE